MDWEDIGKYVKQSKPHIAGISCPFTSRFEYAKRTVEIVRRNAPSAKIVMGGVHPSVAPEQVMKESGVDFAIAGEGENVLLNLVSALDKKEDYENIRGLSFRKDKDVVINRELDLSMDLDSIPHPARDLMDMESYIEQPVARWSWKKNRQTSVFTSRGCPQKCTFCAVHHINSRKWRGRSAQNVVEELEILKREYHIDSIAFEDDNLTADRKRMREICRLILEKDLKFTWCTPNGVAIDTLDRELLKLMKESGCAMLNLAVESGDEHILRDVMQKRLILDHVREIAYMCRELGIAANAYFVIGMPGETENSLQRSLDFAVSLPLKSIGVFIATPFPGTELYKWCLEKGYIDVKNYQKQFYDEPDNSMLHKALIETPVMSRQRIEWWEKRFNKEFWKHQYRFNPFLRFKVIAAKVLKA